MMKLLALLIVPAIVYAQGGPGGFGVPGAGPGGFGGRGGKLFSIYVGRYRMVPLSFPILRNVFNRMNN